MLRKPLDGEHAGHFSHYIGLVPEGDVLGILEEQGAAGERLFRSFAEEQGDDRYAPGKWSLKELLSHMIDTERIMTGRLHRIARGDETAQPGFDQDAYTANAEAGRLSLSFLIDEYAALRRTTLFLLRGIPEEAWTRKGVVSGNTMSARAFVYVVAGHELHHLSIVRERYLKQQ
ncbi:DinB family protein [Gorillibacterium timonense]|uniref:DinB family protein n=1 Tax=Gorillibacterium timonense TaxID=1689269 RepID=UPI00071DAF2A|nr:DinB family protein [Gorillibacterium timonense]